LPKCKAIVLPCPTRFWLATRAGCAGGDSFPLVRGIVITVEDVEHVAKLARLALSDQEKQLYAEQLARIIDYFDQLKSVDTTGVEPLAHALSIVNVMREDEVLAPPGREVLLKNAPDQENGLFRVPRIGE